MNQTTHYQLNQWEAADQVRRTDFNADNARLDAAIKGVEDTASSQIQTVAAKAATAPDVLLRYSLPAAGTTATLNFSGAGNYDVLRLLFWGKVSGWGGGGELRLNGVNGSGRYLYKMSLNESTTSHTSIPVNRFETAENGGGTVDLWLYPAGQHTVVKYTALGVNSTVLSTSQGYGAALNVSFSSLYQISFTVNEAFQYGTKGILLGYKF